MVNFRSLEQTRARLAWEFVHNEIAKKSKNDQKEYRTAIRRLPAMILTSGLGQTVAFHLSKDEGKPHYEIIKNLSRALKGLRGITNIETPEKLIEKIMDADHETYILLSNEALKYATWLKRFAEAELEE